jgi:surface carbohydrate biosynthesis protein
MTKMKKIDVLWLIEHVAREMDVACAVKYLAKARYDLEIEIRHVYLHTLENMSHFEPRVVAMHAFYNAHDLAVKDYVERWPSATFFNLAWEEIFYKGHLKIKAPADRFTREKVIHHAWGKFFKQYLIENGVLEKNVFLNGNPAYELYREPYNKFYPDKKWLAQKYNLDPGKRWIIIPENYRWAFITDSTIAWRVREGADGAELTGMRDFARDSLIHLLKWCSDTAKDTQIEVIFRPKPVTMLTEMEDFFKQHVNEPRSAGLHFIKGESVREWILAGNTVISSFSTTLIEAAIAGKAAYMVEPLPLTESFEADWYEYVPRLHNADEFHAACLETKPPSLNRLKDWAEGEMFSKGDPIAGLADFLHTLAQKTPAPVSLQSRMKNYYRRLRYPYRKTYFNPRTHENDSFDDNYVKQKVAEWGKVLK